MSKFSKLILLVFFWFLASPILSLAAEDINDPHVAGEVLVTYVDQSRPQKNFFNESQISLAQALDYWQSQPSVLAVQPNYLYQIQMETNDKFLKDQAYLDQVEAKKAWEITTGDSKLIVAVIDTGLDRDHPDLEPNIWINEDEISDNDIDDDKNGYVDDRYGYDFALGDPRVEAKLDPRGYTVEAITHGTVVAGIIGARGNNQIGVAGVAHQVRLMGLKALDGLGNGNSYHVSEAITYAVKNGAKFINMSFVGKTGDAVLKNAIKSAYEAGVVIVAAAGNDAKKAGVERGDLDQNPLYPVCFDNKAEQHNWILGVVSVDAQDRHSDFSSYGSNCVDLAAPGEDVASTQIWNGKIPGLEEPYAVGWSGTSFAAPMVTGAAVLAKALAPNLTNRQIYDYLVANADFIDDKNSDFVDKLGSGRLNIYKTLQAIQKDFNLAITPLPTEDASPEPTAPQFIVLGVATSQRPEVQIFDFNGQRHQNFLAYPATYQRGVEVATGDIDGDGLKEIITLPSETSRPIVKIFNLDGEELWQFPTTSKWGSVKLGLTVGDLTDDPGDEVITWEIDKPSPVLAVWNEAGEVQAKLKLSSSQLKKSFSVATIDWGLDGERELVIGSGPSLRPWLRAVTLKGERLWEKKLDPKIWRWGVDVSAGYVDEDVVEDIVLTTRPGALAQVAVYGQLDFEPILDLEPYARSFRNGVRSAPATPGVITAPASKASPHIRIFDATGQLKSQFFAGPRTARLGYSLALY